MFLFGSQAYSVMKFATHLTNLHVSSRKIHVCWSKTFGVTGERYDCMFLSFINDFHFI